MLKQTKKKVKIVKCSYFFHFNYTAKDALNNVLNILKKIYIYISRSRQKNLQYMDILLDAFEIQNAAYFVLFFCNVFESYQSNERRVAHLVKIYNRYQL